MAEIADGDRVRHKELNAEERLRLATIVTATIPSWRTKIPKPDMARLILEFGVKERTIQHFLKNYRKLVLEGDVGNPLEALKSKRFGNRNAKRAIDDVVEANILELHNLTGSRLSLLAFTSRYTAAYGQRISPTTLHRFYKKKGTIPMCSHIKPT